MPNHCYLLILFILFLFSCIPGYIAYVNGLLELDSIDNDPVAKYVLKRLHSSINNGNHDYTKGLPYLVVHATLMLSSNITSVSDSVCKMFDANYNVSSNIRCKALFEITAHSDRVIWVNKVFNHFVNISISSLLPSSMQHSPTKEEMNEPRIDATLLAISQSLTTKKPIASVTQAEPNTSAINPPLSNDITICMFGSFSPKIALTYLVSGKNHNLILIDDQLSGIQDTSMFRYLKELYQDKRIIHVFSDKEFILFTRGLTLCDVLHVRDNISHLLFQYIIDNLARSNIRNKVDDLFIYESTESIDGDDRNGNNNSSLENDNENDNGNNSNHGRHNTENSNNLTNNHKMLTDLSKYIYFYATSLTPSQSTLNLLEDSQGFKNIMYSGGDNFNTTITLNFGTIKQIVEILNVSITCDSRNDPQDKNKIIINPQLSDHANSDDTISNSYSTTGNSRIMPATTVTKRIHFIITYTSRLFQDNAYGLQEALLLVPQTFSSSKTNCIITDDGHGCTDNVTLDITAEVLGMSPLEKSNDPMLDIRHNNRNQGHNNKIDCSNSSTCNHSQVDSSSSNEKSHINKTDDNIIIVQIAFGCHSPQIYFKHYICYQTEQPWSYIFKSKAQTPLAHISSTIMSNAIAVFAMSKMQLLKLYKTDYSVQNAYVVPFYTKTISEQIPLLYGNGVSNDLENDTLNNDFNTSLDHNSSTRMGNNYDNNYYFYDILMYGACTQSRHNLHQQLKVYSETYNKTIKVICVADWKSALFDEELEYHIKCSKVVVNNHSFDGSSLQTHRLIYLFSLGKCVINERSSDDPELDSEYEDVVIFSDNGSHTDVITKLHDVLMNETKWQECKTKAFEKYTNIHNDVAELSEAVYKAYKVMIMI